MGKVDFRTDEHELKDLRPLFFSRSPRADDSLEIEDFPDYLASIRKYLRYGPDVLQHKREFGRARVQLSYIWYVEPLGAMVKLIGIAMMAGAVLLCAAMLVVALPHVFMRGASAETMNALIYAIAGLAALEVLSSLAILIATRSRTAPGAHSHYTHR